MKTEERIDNTNVPTFDPKIEAIEDENEDYGDWRPQFLQEDRTFPDYDARC